MKTFILITTVLLSQLCLAGTGGGGVMMRTLSGKDSKIALATKLPTEIVYNIGNQNGVAKFAYGQLVNNEWQVQEIEMPQADLMNDVSVVKALQDSSVLKSWVEIK